MNMDLPGRQQQNDILSQNVGEVVPEGTGPLIKVSLFYHVVGGAGDDPGLGKIIGKLYRADTDGIVRVWLSSAVVTLPSEIG